MADTANIQVQTYDGVRNAQVKTTLFSDGSGLTAYPLLVSGNLNPPPGPHLKVRRLRFSVHLMEVRVQWDGATPQDIAILNDGEDILDFAKDFSGGISNTATGPTGNIVLTTQGQVQGSNFTIELDCVKGV